MSIEKIVLGGGCFWCVESVFLGIAGVRSVVSGYSGGHDTAPTYESVCSGTTGHAEVVEVTFDNTEIALKDLLLIFFSIHDPTTLDRQGNDVGTQYRSVIFYRSPDQKTVAESVIAGLKDTFVSPIVTQLEPLTDFYVAEEYHQNYFERNPGNRYCQYAIPPKTKKVFDKFPQFIK